MFLLPIHIAAGLVSVAAGLLSLGVAKGSPLHRRSGMVFSIAMMTMTASAVIMALFFVPNRGNAVGGTLTFYLVATGLLTVVRSVEDSRRILRALMALALAASGYAFVIGLGILAGDRMRWMAIPLLLFGTVGTLAATADARLLRAGTITGAARLKRHLWRMSTALWVATASLFLGQARILPEPLRHAGGLRAIPVIWVLVMMIYWLARLRSGRSLRARIPDATTVPAGR